MQKVIITLSIIILSHCFGFGYKELIIENRDNKPIRVIKVVLDWEHYIVSSVAWDWWATLQELTQKVWWDTSVNWAFFCPDDYSNCKTTHTISERVYMWNGKDTSAYRPDTSIRMIFGFDKTWEPMLIQNNLWNMHDLWLRVNPQPEKFNSLYFGIWNFPVFLYQWENVINWYTNYIDTKMKTAGNKTFICHTQDKSTVYMWVIWWINLLQMPDYLSKNFDCRDAINLDAWSSIGMIYSWYILDQWPRKRIMDAFVVLTREQYINLTNTTPTYKTSFTPPTPVSLNHTQLQNIQKLYLTIKPHLSTKKQSLISLLRSAITTPTITSDPVRSEIIKTLLLKLFTIDTL